MLNSANEQLPTPSPFTYSYHRGQRRYCTICILLGRECPGRQKSSERDEEEEKDTEEKGQDPEASPKLAIVALAQSLQPPKLFITKYFDNMLNNPPIRATPRDIRRCEITVAQQELNEIVCEIPEQDPLDEMD